MHILFIPQIDAGLTLSCQELDIYRADHSPLGGYNCFHLYSKTEIRLKLLVFLSFHLTSEI